MLSLRSTYPASQTPPTPFMLAQPALDPLPARAAMHRARSWRDRPAGAPHLLVSRWQSNNIATSAQPPSVGDWVTIDVALRSTHATLRAGGQIVCHGRVPAGSVHISAPGEHCEATFSAPADMLHLFVSRAALEALPDKVRGGALFESLSRTGSPMTDTTVERLAWSLLKAGDVEGNAADLYIEGIALAMVARVLSMLGQKDDESERARGLPKWRLKRVFQHVEARLEERLSLADLAACAGLSRMYFAAQFRASTGLSPHEYVVKKRIERAQEYLRDTSMPLAEVGLAVGFQTQAHFTTVFKRLLGETPGQWRRLRS